METKHLRTEKQIDEWGGKYRTIPCFKKENFLVYLKEKKMDGIFRR